MSAEEPRVVSYQEFQDPRGNLSVLDRLPELIGFPVHRCFIITDVPDAGTRGEHAHESCWQAIGCVRGKAFLESSFVLDVLGPKMDRHLYPMNPGKCVVVPPLHWIVLKEFRGDAICHVVCSHEYDAKEVVNDKRDWRRMIQSQSLS